LKAELVTSQESMIELGSDNQW